MIGRYLRHPQEFNRDLKTVNIFGAERAKQSQIYYLWHQANKQY